MVANDARRRRGRTVEIGLQCEAGRSDGSESRIVIPALAGTLALVVGLGAALLAWRSRLRSRRRLERVVRQLDRCLGEINDSLAGSGSPSISTSSSRRSPGRPPTGQAPKPRLFGFAVRATSPQSAPSDPIRSPTSSSRPFTPPADGRSGPSRSTGSSRPCSRQTRTSSAQHSWCRWSRQASRRERSPGMHASQRRSGPSMRAHSRPSQPKQPTGSPQPAGSPL